LARLPRTTTLDQLRQSAQEIDYRYWERQREKSREGQSNGNSERKSDKDSDKKGKNSGNQSSHSANSAPNNNQSGNQSNSKNNNQSGSKNNNANNQRNNSASGSDKSANAPKPYANVLDKDGKLKPEERKRRMELNLCMFCGKKNHKAADCRSKGSSASQGRSVKTEQQSSATPKGSEK